MFFYLFSLFFEMTENSEKDPAYFGYYAQFIHQQNMLSDQIRVQTLPLALLIFILDKLILHFNYTK